MLAAGDNNGHDRSGIRCGELIGETGGAGDVNATAPPLVRHRDRGWSPHSRICRQRLPGNGVACHGRNRCGQRQRCVTGSGHLHGDRRCGGPG